MKIGIISYTTKDANNFLNSVISTLPVEDIKKMTMIAGRRLVCMEDGTEYEVLNSDLDLLRGYKAVRFYLSKKLPESFSIEVTFRNTDHENALIPFIIYF